MTMTSPPTALPPEPAFPLRADLLLLAAVLTVLAGLGWANRQLLTVLADLCCAVAGMATFLVIWNARRQVEQGFFLVLGMAFLAAAALDGARLALAAMPELYLGDFSAGLHAVSQLTLAAGLAGGAWLPRKRTLSVAAAGACLAGLTASLTLALLALGYLDAWGLSNAAEAGGREVLAAFAHGVAAAFFLTAGAGIWRDRQAMPSTLAWLLAAAMTALAAAGAAEALGGCDLMAARLLQVLGYGLGCQAIVVVGINRPSQLLFQEINRREQELTGRMVRLGAQARAIFDLSGAPSLESGQFEPFAAALLRRAMAVLGISRAGIWRFTPAHDRLVCQIGQGTARADEGLELVCAAYPDYFAAVLHERVIVADNAAVAPLTRAFHQGYLKSRDIGALLDAPFRFAGRTTGVLCLEHLNQPRRWSDDEIAFAGSLSDMLSLALESAERRRAARELAESEQRLRTLLDAMPDPVCFKDAAGRWIVANQAQIEAYSLAGLEWQGRTDQELAAIPGLDPDVFATGAETDARAWASRSVTVYGFSMAAAAGNMRHFDVTKAPLFHVDGTPRGLVALSRDITAYRDALARLRETNAELEAIYNETSDGLIIADAAARTMVRVNAAACRMFGYTAPEMAGLEPCALHPPEEREAARRRFAAIAAGSRQLQENVPCLRRSGEVFHADISAQPVTYGGRSAILAFFRDISERRAGEERLRLSEDRFRKVFNSTYDAIFLHDQDGAVIDVNDKALELFDLRRDELPALRIDRDLSAPEMPQPWLTAAWREALAGAERFFEWKARRPHDDSLIDVEIYLRRILVGSGHQILANIRDVTERKRVTAALAARQEEISALNRDLARRVREETEKNRQKDILLLNRTRLAAMGEMIGNIAHQWRQPLNALSILLANLRFEYESVCQDTAALDAAHRQAYDILRRMSATIDDFRNFFKPARDPEPFRVVAAISDALLLIDASLAQHGIQVRFTARHDPVVHGPRGEFAQVILNLLGNAKDAILARKPVRGRIDIRVMQRLGRAVVAVADNGGGIASDILDRIFDPYYTTKDSQDGTGLGLYMSRIIVADHLGGVLTVDNRTEGARFVAALPLSPTSPRFGDAP
ncbi:PAS domain S-box protein [Solidesulfovibrio carbinolicus]|nr:PAS domain S-box protein [Solidesulfovibrio carbinolicus]